MRDLESRDEAGAAWFERQQEEPYDRREAYGESLKHEPRWNGDPQNAPDGPDDDEAAELARAEDDEYDRAYERKAPMPEPSTETLDRLTEILRLATPADVWSERVSVEITVHGLGLNQAIQLAQLGTEYQDVLINNTLGTSVVVKRRDIDGLNLSLQLHADVDTPFGPAEPDPGDDTANEYGLTIPTPDV